MVIILELAAHGDLSSLLSLFACIAFLRSFWNLRCTLPTKELHEAGWSTPIGCCKNTRCLFVDDAPCLYHSDLSLAVVDSFLVSAWSRLWRCGQSFSKLVRHCITCTGATAAKPFGRFFEIMSPPVSFRLRQRIMHRDIKPENTFLCISTFFWAWVIKSE